MEKERRRVEERVAWEGKGRRKAGREGKGRGGEGRGAEGGGKLEQGRQLAKAGPEYACFLSISVASYGSL